MEKKKLSVELTEETTEIVSQLYEKFVQQQEKQKKEIPSIDLFVEGMLLFFLQSLKKNPKMMFGLLKGRKKK